MHWDKRKKLIFKEKETINMAIVRYTPSVARGGLLPVFGFGGRSPWAGLESEIDRLFDTALTGFGAPVGNRFPVDLYEDKDNTYVRAELPGVSKDDINVEMVEDYLTVTAARKQKTDEGEESLSFSRSVAIPEHVQTGKVSASYENGILTVTLPKREEAKPKRINVAVK